jgi:hypothetical protein
MSTRIPAFRAAFFADKKIPWQIKVLPGGMPKN